jgi:hypothetical protein
MMDMDDHVQKLRSVHGGEWKIQRNTRYRKGIKFRSGHGIWEVRYSPPDKQWFASVRSEGSFEFDTHTDFYPTPVDAVDALIDKVGSSRWNQACSGGTLVLVPDQGEPLKIEPDMEPVQLEGHGKDIADVPDRHEVVDSDISREDVIIRQSSPYWVAHCLQYRQIEVEGDYETSDCITIDGVSYEVAFEPLTYDGWDKIKSVLQSSIHDPDPLISALRSQADGMKSVNAYDFGQIDTLNRIADLLEEESNG